ncbi:hypothetical protein H5410_037126 [Solanum commersonii]|uniref:Uncharacterized protein n=1 Tax=Solanum commersonii TaxID=4109 RepID=A0A9J5YAA2_SOLCO|nr:hypothetical protein H5410_037126 [Solanum commersonii]
MAVVESGSNDTGCGTHFSSKQSLNGNSAFTVESEIPFPIRFHICGKRSETARGEKIPDRESEHAWWLCRLWLSREIEHV